jgi:TonB family protein
VFTIDFRKFGGLGKNLTRIILLITPAFAFAAQDSKVACKPGNPPVWPSEARKEGVEGTVKAKILVKSGEVQDIQILSGPEAFHESVKATIRQYKCDDDGTGTEKSVTQEFRFYFEKTPEADKTKSPKLASTANLEMISCPDPVYPRRAEQDGIEGSTTVRFLVAEEGIVVASEVLISSKNTDLDLASTEAIKKCIFKPPLSNGVPSRVYLTRQYNWKVPINDHNFKTQSMVYTPSQSTKELLTSNGFDAFSFGDFEYSGMPPTCRMGTSPIISASVEKFLKYAFNEELRNSQKYNIEKNVVRGRILELKYSTLGGGYWEISIELSSENGRRTIERSRIEFPTEYNAIKSCQAAVNSFPLLVKQIFVQFIVKDEFREFFK